MNEKKPLITKQGKRFDTCYFLLCVVFLIVLLCTGFNFLPLVANVLAIVSALLILLQYLTKKEVSFYMWLSYLTINIGLFIFFLIWGAESFGKNLWYNFVLILGPVVTATFLYLIDNVITKEKIVRLSFVSTVILMVGTSVVYLFFMNLRVKPTAESLWEGHDEYLKSVNKADSSAPNVLVILMDDMAFSDISSYSYLGSEQATINTPNIDAIANQGIMMDNFYSASPVCSPSRFSILTGRYSSRGYLDNVIFPTDIQSNPYSFTHFVNPYQFLNNVDGILGDEITFAEVLQAAGYNTGCIGKWNLGDYGEYLPTNQGFNYFYGSYYVNDMTPYNWVEDTNKNGTTSHQEVRTHAENLDQSESSELFTAKMVNFINTSVENNEKFFAYYTSPWPHFPIYSNNSGEGKGNENDDTYIQCIEEFDKYLGNIIQALKENGVYDDTLIIFTSDNGPGREGVTGNLRGRKNTTFDGGMKVPCIASYPNGNLGQGSQIASQSYNYYQWVDSNGIPVTNVTRQNIGSITKSTTPTMGSTKHIEASSMNFDLFTTILSYCGINSLPNDRIIDGVNLKQLWNAEVASDHRVHDIIYYQKGGKTQGIQMALECEGTVYDFKYYDRVHTENSAFIDQFYKNYLFNLDLDPAEGYSISKTYPDIAAQCKEQLLAFRNEMKTNRRGKI